jgi:nicotinamide-nucleotide amidase
MSVEPDSGRLAAQVLALLAGRRETVATAESLTGGLLGAALTAVAGSSAVYRGGVVAYATDLKAALLGVPAGLLAQRGPIDAEVAQQMADGARVRLRATFGLATTGVAGPQPQDGRPVGTVFLGFAGPAHTRSRQLHLTGGRAAIRTAAVHAALNLLLSAVSEHAEEALG